MTGASIGLGEERGSIWVPADPATAKGPYFKDAAGKKVFGLKLAETAADGRIILPELFTDTGLAPGPYTFRLVTPDGVTLILKVEVTAPAATPAPETDTPK